MTKIVYKVLKFEDLYDETGFKKMKVSLNKHAEKGWELISASHTDHFALCFLKGKDKG